MHISTSIPVLHLVNFLQTLIMKQEGYKIFFFCSISTCLKQINTKISMPFKMQIYIFKLLIKNKCREKNILESYQHSYHDFQSLYYINFHSP